MISFAHDWKAYAATNTTTHEITHLTTHLTSHLTSHSITPYGTNVSPNLTIDPPDTPTNQATDIVTDTILRYSTQRVPVSSPMRLGELYQLVDRREVMQQLQCRNLLAAIIDSRQMGTGFYTRKVFLLQSLQLSDAKLTTLQSRFGSIFHRLAMFEQKGTPLPGTQLSQEASQLVNELNQYCFY
jgi:hypothetical protein